MLSTRIASLLFCLKSDLRKAELYLMASTTRGELTPALQQQPLELMLLIDRYSVLRLNPASTPLTMLTKIISCTTASQSSVVSSKTSLVNLSITPAEISVVLPTLAILHGDDDVYPQAMESGWLAFRVEPPIPGQGIDFGVVGIMARISGLLAKAEISLFAVSTFDTDYILVKEDKIAIAVRALGEDSCCIVLLEDPENVLWTDLGLCRRVKPV